MSKGNRSISDRNKIAGPVSVLDCRAGKRVGRTQGPIDGGGFLQSKERTGVGEGI